MVPKFKEKPKPSVSPPAQSLPLIEDLFTTLDRHIQRSEFEQVVKVADQVLSIAPCDEDAFRCKVIALIRADKFDTALSLIQSQKLLNDFGFLKAYCLYRQNKLNEALESLKGLERSSEIMLLESQVLYRLGKMNACVDVYQKLQRSKIESLDINIVAALVSAGRASEVEGFLEALRVKATSSFELAYNTACSLIEKNEYTDAQQLLLSARRIGQETLLEENLAEDEIENELAPVAVQLAYLLQLLGQTREATGAYTDIINRNLADESSLAVAVNNLVSLKGPNVSQSLKRLDRLIEKADGAQKFCLTGGLDQKLSLKQKEAIYTNRVLLLLHANRMDQARELVSVLPAVFASSVTPALLQAAVLVRENKAGRAEDVLLQFAEKFPEKSKAALLARAQVAASAGHLQIAAESLSRIPDIQHTPATVATLVALKERAGDIDGANAALDATIERWSNAMTEDDKLDVIMHAAASFKLKHGRKEEASSLYEELVKSRHGGVGALVGLVATAARVNVDKAEAYAKQLRPLPGLKEIDADALEKTAGAKPAEEGHEEKSREKTRRKKRKRKPRYPKGFDPANPGPPPDPERWLPKRERSSYRPKRKDKRAAQVRGSQGTVVRDKQHDGGAAGVISGSNAASGKSSQARPPPPPSKGTSGDHQSKPPSKSSKKKSRR